MDTNDIADKMWVRAEGTVMDDQRRIQVSRMQVLGEDAGAYRQGVYFQAGHERGYLLRVRRPFAGNGAK